MCYYVKRLVVCYDDDAARGAHQERRMKMELTPPIDDTADGSTTRIH